MSAVSQSNFPVQNRENFPKGSQTSGLEGKVKNISSKEFKGGFFAQVESSVKDAASLVGRVLTQVFTITGVSFVLRKIWDLFFPKTVQKETAADLEKKVNGWKIGAGILEKSIASLENSKKRIDQNLAHLVKTDLASFKKPNIHYVQSLKSGKLVRKKAMEISFTSLPSKAAIAENLEKRQQIDLDLTKKEIALQGFYKDLLSNPLTASEREKIEAFSSTLSQKLSERAEQKRALGSFLKFEGKMGAAQIKESFESIGVRF